MGRVLLKSAVTAIASLVVTFFLGFVVFPAIGRAVDANALMLLTLFPLLVAWLASAFAFSQAENRGPLIRIWHGRMPSLPRHIAASGKRQAETR